MKRKILFIMSLILCIASANAQKSNKLSKEDKKKIESIVEDWYTQYALYRDHNQNKDLQKTTLVDVVSEETKLKEKAALLARLDSINAVKKIVKDSVVNYSDALIYAELEKKCKAEEAPLVAKIKELEGYREQWNSELAAGAELKWLNKLYRDIDVAELELEYKRFETSNSNDAKIQKTKQVLKTLLTNTSIFNNAEKAINSKYNPLEVRLSLDNISKIINEEQNSKNKEDLLSIQQQLSAYADKVKKFKSVIDLVAKQQNRFPNHDRSIRFVDVVLKQNDVKIKDIKNNPWLCEQYNQYYKALHENCLVENDAQKRIKALYNKHFAKIGEK